MEFINVKLNRIGCGELQMICKEISWEHGMRKAIETFDSSKMDASKQINHLLMKLEKSMKNEFYNEDIEKLSKEAAEEFSIVKDIYSIAIPFLPILLKEALKEVNNLDLLITRVYGNSEHEQYYPKMAENYRKRHKALKECFESITKAAEELS